MSCNGCRVLRKGCNDKCILRQSFQGIVDTPQAQANATLFLAKFFGRAVLLSFLSSVPQSQRPALFQSLLFEACGRTVNPVSGAVGLLSTGNWHACQSAVETVLQGGPLPEPDDTDTNEITRGLDRGSTTPGFVPPRMTARGRSVMNHLTAKRRLASPSDDSSETTTLETASAYPQRRSVQQFHHGNDSKLLRLFF